MEVEVSLYKTGKLWKESYEAQDFQDARELAKVKHPGATIVGVSANISKELLPDYYQE